MMSMGGNWAFVAARSKVCHATKCKRSPNCQRINNYAARWQSDINLPV